MAAAQPKVFDKAAFIRAVEEAIARRAPQNLEQADKFGESGAAAEIKTEVQGKVGEGKDAAASELAGTTAQVPQPAPDSKTVVPLAPDNLPERPGAPDPSQAAPDALPLSATDMSAGPARVDQQMADAQVTEKQLSFKNSREPSFDKAVRDKSVLEAHSAAAPGELRGGEAREIKQVRTAAGKDGASALAAMHGTRVATGRRVGAGKTGAKGRDEELRARVTTVLQSVFDETKADVEKMLSDLDGKIDRQFTEEEKQARERFTAEHTEGMRQYKAERYSGKTGWTRWLRDLRGLPEDANRIYERAKEQYLIDMQQTIARIADTVEAVLGRAKDRIAHGRARIKAAVDKLPADLRAIGREAAVEFDSRFAELGETVTSKGTELVDTLATRYTEAVTAVDEEIAAEKEKNKGFLSKAVDAVMGAINTILELKNQLLGMLRKAAQAIDAILKDPIGFLGNLISAVGGGLRLFIKNVGRHLSQGVLSWLLGTASSAGLQLPAKFDVRGILLMIAGLLGLTWGNIRARITRRVPDQAVTAAETAVPMVVAAKRQGVAGLWEDLKGRLGDLKQELIGRLVSYLTPTVVTAGITWVLSLLNPASAFIRACKMIIDFVQFVLTQGRQILEFVNSVLDAVIAIAKGSGGGVPVLVERALARSIPVLIGVLAAILGVGGIASKVRQIFQQLAQPVNREIDRIVDKIVGLVKTLPATRKAKLDGAEKGTPGRLRKAKLHTRRQPGGRYELRRPARPRRQGKLDEKAGKKPAKKAQAGPVGDHLVWTVRAKSHRLWIARIGGRYVPMLASEPHPVERAIVSYKQAAGQLAATDKKAGEAKAAIDQAEVHQTALVAALASYGAESRAEATAERLAGARAAVEAAQQSLRDAVAEVQRLLGHDDMDRVKAAKNRFGLGLFSTKDLAGLLGLQDASGLVNGWLRDGIVFRLESSRSDPLGMNTFDPAVAGSRETDTNNRYKYGYVNPRKTSPKGLLILTKGLLGSLNLIVRGIRESVAATWIDASPAEKTDPEYHQDRAYYRSVVNPERFPQFRFPDAVLGHAGKGAADHWNREGHKQHRDKNLEWNTDVSNYHGPEHKEESAESGSKAPRYKPPVRGESHESWFSAT